MPLPAGARLGPYEIAAPIGAGGMGEVYRARDTRLDRTVAIKILPSQVAGDADFRDRFDREARSIAALNHPHICTLHDVGHHEGTDFLVMELVEGQTLAERLQQGPLPVREALAVAEQIADALVMVPRFSPDGGRIALHIANVGNPDVWVYDIARGALSRLTFSTEADTHPIWTPDGERVTYESGGTPNIYWVRADGSGQPERLTNGPHPQRASSWSPDGRVLAYSQVDERGGTDLWTLRIDGDRTPQPFLQTPAFEASPEFSPDGRWLAYHSNESGRLGVYVRPFPNNGGKWQVSTHGGSFPDGPAKAGN